MTFQLRPCFPVPVTAKLIGRICIVFQPPVPVLPLPPEHFPLKVWDLERDLVGGHNN